MEVIRAATGQTGLGHMATTFSARSPQLYLDIDRTKAESLKYSPEQRVRHPPGLLGSTYVNLFNKFNQVFQVYVQADAPYRLQPGGYQEPLRPQSQGGNGPPGHPPEINRTLGSELVTRYNLYPAAAGFWGGAPGFSSGQAIRLMETDRGNKLPRGMSYDWTATSSRTAGGQPSLLHYALSITLVFMVLAAQNENWLARRRSFWSYPSPWWGPIGPDDPGLRQ